MDLEIKEESLTSLQRELDELTLGGKTDDEVSVLRKQKIECERRVNDQEEELDELAGQVQLLEQAKLKLEMDLEQHRKSAKKDSQQFEEEIEEIRCNAQKKTKSTKLTHLNLFPVYKGFACSIGSAIRKRTRGAHVASTRKARTRTKISLRPGVGQKRQS